MGRMSSLSTCSLRATPSDSLGCEVRSSVQVSFALGAFGQDVGDLLRSQIGNSFFVPPPGGLKTALLVFSACDFWRWEKPNVLFVRLAFLISCRTTVK